MTRVIRPRAALAFFLLTTAAHAFGPEGHQLAGEIAERHLTPRAQAEVRRLLRHDRLADRSPSGRRTLGEVANWADEIRDFPWGKARGAWHYDDIPVCEAPDPARYCRVDCASKRLAEQLGILAERSAPLRRRNEALKWVVHLVADIHQPLHAADNHDRGGNTVRVSFFGETDNPPYGPLNLHALWDVHILRRLLGEPGGNARLAAPIAAADRDAWQAGSIADWMAESNDLAKRVVYGNLPGGLACGAAPAGTVDLGEDYYAKAAPVVARQIRKAGVRLARVLNKALI
jgi:hypothetical protein